MKNNFTLYNTNNTCTTNTNDILLIILYNFYNTL